MNFRKEKTMDWERFIYTFFRALKRLVMIIVAIIAFPVLIILKASKGKKSVDREVFWFFRW